MTQSWIDGANEPHGFGLDHLPYGCFTARQENLGALAERRLCVRLGDRLLDLRGCAEDGLLASLAEELRSACRQPHLNLLLSLGCDAWQELRQHLIALLREDADTGTRTRVSGCLHRMVNCRLMLPVDIGGYTDFYASLHHARRVGELFRPGQPLLPNYKHVPIAYNGRASSVVVSGTDVRRPWGQTGPAEAGADPRFGPTCALDYELEIAFVTGPGNALGEPLPMERARQTAFGVALLNDWSARDIQAWEYQPLGPFLGKSFATSVSPWITPLAALEPFRVAAPARASGDPRPLPYLWSEEDQRSGGFDIAVEVQLSTAASRAAGLPPMPISQANTREHFWTPAQMYAHHTSNGCNLRPGDLLATGTISGVERSSGGCLLELTGGGQEALSLPNGEQRSYLQDGDEVTLVARCQREGRPLIVLGECRGRIVGGGHNFGPDA